MKQLTSFLRLLLLITALAVSAAPQQLARGQTNGIQSPVPGHRPQSAKVKQPPPQVTYKDGRLSGRFEGVGLASVLKEVSQASQVAIILSAGVGNAATSADWHEVPLEEALRSLLKDTDYFLLYGSHRKMSGTGLQAVWVYPAGAAAGLEPTPPAQWATVKELKTMLADQDPAVRGAAIEGLVERLQGRAAEDVRKSLADGDEGVRTRALFAAESQGVKLSDADLQLLLTGDQSANVRFLALQGLQTGPEAALAAEAALQDPDPHVRELAREILERRRAAENPRPPTPPSQQQSQNNRPH